MNWKILFSIITACDTHGTILAENGAQPKTVMERLGHKDLKTTMEKYVFNTDKMKDDAVQIFMQAIGQ